ncbi:MAG: aminodeoxychorismate/anthranilate synthase component II [Lawsonella sp.]|nr:aminodeoxychorismate/anthranilate synthase component II [Mycobacteriales bacterium]
MILLIDNFDSFTYNLYHQLAGSQVTVLRNDAIDIAGIRSLNPEAIILSPGPGRPDDAGICLDVMRDLTGEYPILGVCLGHQALCQAFGATVTYAPELMHGKSSDITIDPTDALFQGLPSRITVARYHSLVADPATMPEELLVTAHADDGTIMAVTHRNAPTYGVQFHPESILTPHGQHMIDNFLAGALHD